MRSFVVIMSATANFEPLSVTHEVQAVHGGLQTCVARLHDALALRGGRTTFMTVAKRDMSKMTRITGICCAFHCFKHSPSTTSDQSTVCSGFEPYPSGVSGGYGSCVHAYSGISGSCLHEELENSQMTKFSENLAFWSPHEKFIMIFNHQSLSTPSRDP